MGIFDQNIWLLLIGLALLTQGGLALMAYRTKNLSSSILPTPPLRVAVGLGWALLGSGLVLVVLQIIHVFGGKL